MVPFWGYETIHVHLYVASIQCSNSEYNIESSLSLSLSLYSDVISARLEHELHSYMYSILLLSFNDLFLRYDITKIAVVLELIVYLVIVVVYLVKPCEAECLFKKRGLSMTLLQERPMHYKKFTWVLSWAVNVEGQPNDSCRLSVRLVLNDDFPFIANVLTSDRPTLFRHDRQPHVLSCMLHWVRRKL